MAHIEDRWYAARPAPDGTKRRKSRHGVGLRWRVRFTTPDGREDSESFARKGDAQAFLIKVEADLRRGVFVDLDAGKISFAEYAERHIADRSIGELTRYQVSRQLARHVYPVIGDRPLRALATQASVIQALVRQLGRELQPGTVRGILGSVSGVFAAAVDDGLIARNPCSARSVRPPAPSRTKVVPWPAERVRAVRDALPDRWRVVVDLGAGLGLRQGEVLGLAVDDVDFLRGVVHVRRQVQVLKGRRYFCLPKGGRTRDVPLASSVGLALSAHLATFPAVEVTLPWGGVDGEPATVRLVVTSQAGGAVIRDTFGGAVWHPALRAAGVQVCRANGMHALRHYWASVLLDAGESIRAVADYLGHADAGFTLRTYTHLLPSSEERTRRAVDAMMARMSDGPTTAQARA